MPTFFRCKHPSLPCIFSNFMALKHKNGEIEDDWEIIEFLDQEFACEENNDASVEEEDEDMFDLGEANFLTFSSLQHSNFKIKYKILSKDDVLQRLEHKITEVSDVLLLQRSEASLLLQHFKDVNRTYDEWLDCEEKVRKEVGLFVKPVVETSAVAAEVSFSIYIACRICNTEFPRDAMFSVSCGHQICRSCWKGYIREAINDGARCLTLRCAEPSCTAAVNLDLIKLVSSEGDKEKFENHVLKYYLACSGEGKWCPAPNCNYAVLSSGGGEGNVTCQCLHSFCWNDNGLKEKFRKPLERYNHYYTEWATCESLEILRGMFGISPNELDFLVEALLQVIECWQFLKWTHVYGYYLPADEDVKKQLLEFMQEEATGHVRRLHDHVNKLLENPLRKSLKRSCLLAWFVESRSKIMELTRVVRDHFDHLMEGLKSGLPEVSCTAKSSPRHKISRDREETDCCKKSSIQRLSPSPSPIAKFMRGIGGIDISSPLGNSKSADLTAPKIENN
ncbi:putative E3 ubiquitin-protein ligase ARI8 [Bienertia sinuspersici]